MKTLRPFAALHEAMWLHLNGKYESAEEIFRLIRGEPAASIARRQLILLLRTQHRWEEALAVLREHAAQHPEDPEIAFYLAINLLGVGRYKEAWPLYENRRRAAGASAPPAFNAPEWRGEPVGSLLVVDEQGAGDSIQFARYVPLLAARGIAVTVLCRPQLAPLFTSVWVPVVEAGSGAVLPAFEAWRLIGSLPGLFGTSVETIPSGPYLAAPADRRALWAEKLPAAARIGVSVRGQPTHPNDANRSLSAEAAAVAQSFQGAVSLEATSPLGLRDFADTAAVIERLDLVISVDTAVAHLAGALGKPCWVLLPHTPDWRWLHDRTDSPWHPSLRLYRQPAPGDWTSVLGMVRRDLALRYGGADQALTASNPLCGAD